MTNTRSYDVFDVNKTYIRWNEFYDTKPGIKSVWTQHSFKSLLKTNREYFGETVAFLRNGIFVLDGFEEKISAWNSVEKPSNIESLQAGLAQSRKAKEEAL